MSRKTIASILLGLALPIACAGASSDPATTSRIDALERRMAKIEAMLAPDVSTTPSHMTPHAVSAPDASLASDVSPHVGPRMWAVEPTPTEAFDHCMSRATKICRRMALDESTRPTKPSGDGGFQWVKTEPLPAADSTRAGRQCLQKERKQCDRERAGVERELELRNWMDAQVESDKLDRTFSKELERRILREIGLRPGDVAVACIKELCRVKGRNGAFDAGREMGDLHRFMSQRGGSYMTKNDERGPVLYATRDGYNFPKVAPR